MNAAQIEKIGDETSLAAELARRMSEGYRPLSIKERRDLEQMRLSARYLQESIDVILSDSIGE